MQFVPVSLYSRAASHPYAIATTVQPPSTVQVFTMAATVMLAQAMHRGADLMVQNSVH